MSFHSGIKMNSEFINENSLPFSLFLSFSLIESIFNRKIGDPFYQADCLADAGEDEKYPSAGFIHDQRC